MIAESQWSSVHTDILDQCSHKGGYDSDVTGCVQLAYQLYQGQTDELLTLYYFFGRLAISEVISDQGVSEVYDFI